MCHHPLPLLHPLLLLLLLLLVFFFPTMPTPTPMAMAHFLHPAPPSPHYLQRRRRRRREERSVKVVSLVVLWSEEVSIDLSPCCAPRHKGPRPVLLLPPPLSPQGRLTRMRA